MDRAANRSPRLSQTHQPQPQTQSNQLTTQNGTGNSAQSNSANQSQSPRLTQAFFPQNTAHGLAGLFTNKDEREAINIKEFSALKISSYSSNQFIQSPSTKPELTNEIFSQICSAQSKSDLKKCMRIVGVSSLQELCEMKFEKKTVLMVASETGNAKLTSLLLQSVADPQKLVLMLSDDDNKRTALMFAAAGSAEVVTALLSGVPNPQQLAEKINNSTTALIYAALHENVEVIIAMLASVPNPQKLAEKIDNNGTTALKVATFFSNVRVITALLNGVPNPQQLAEQNDKNGSTALMLAASNGLVGVITKIFKCIDNTDALIFQVDIDGMNAFMRALGKRKTEAALMIFDKAKDKASLMFKQNGPDQKAAIQMMSPDILEMFVKKFNETKE